MKPKRPRGTVPPPPPLAEISGSDRDLLAHAYKAGLILGWKVAGYYGVDRYLLPILGTPWRPGAIAGRNTHAVVASAG